MSQDFGGAYRETRERISTMIRGAGDQADEGRVPACPEWSPKDVVSHVTGVAADILSGNLEGVASEPWTEVQVAARREKSPDEVIAEWEEHGSKLEPMLGGFGDAGAQLLFDLVTHEYDVTEALGLPIEGGSASERVALGFAMGAFVDNAKGKEVPPLNVVSADKEWSVGEGAPEATLTVSAYDMLRSLTGRRTADEVRALDWDVSDPGPWLPAFELAMFKLRETSTRS